MDFSHDGQTITPPPRCLCLRGNPIVFVEAVCLDVIRRCFGDRLLVVVVSLKVVYEILTLAGAGEVRLVFGLGYVVGTFALIGGLCYRIPYQAFQHVEQFRVQGSHEENLEDLLNLPVVVDEPADYQPLVYNAEVGDLPVVLVEPKELLERVVEQFLLDGDELTFIVGVLTSGGPLSVRLDCLRGYLGKSKTRVAHELSMSVAGEEPLSGPIVLEIQEAVLKMLARDQRGTAWMRSSDYARPRGYLTPPTAYSDGDVHIIHNIHPMPEVMNSKTLEGKRLYLMYRAYFLSQQITVKTHRVAANAPAWLILSHRTDNISERELIRVIEQARVYIHVFNAPIVLEDKRATIYDYILAAGFLPAPGRSLLICGTRVQSADVIEFHSSVFGKTNKSIVRAACKYLRGEIEIHDLSRFEATLSRCVREELGSVVAVNFEFRVQGWCNRAVAELEEDPIDTLERRAIQAIAFLVNLLTQRSVLGAVSAIVQFLTSYPLLWRYVKLRTLAMQEELIAEFKKMRPQGVTDWIQSYFSHIKVAVFDCLFVIVTEMKDGFYKDLYPLYELFVKNLKIETVKLSAKHIAEKVVTNFRLFLSRCKTAYELKSFKPLLGERYDPKSWIILAEGYETHAVALTSNSTANSANRRKLIETGLFPSWWDKAPAPSVFCGIIEAHLQVGENMRMVFRGDQTLVTILGRAVSSFKVFVTTWRRKINGSNMRHQPFGVMMLGQPGCGKSVLANMVKNAIGVTFGYDVSAAGTYNVPLDQNFLDAADHTKWCWTFDDVDQANYDPYGKNAISLNIGVINNNPFQIESANIEDKGVNYCAANLVTWTGNHLTCKISSTGATPEAFFRRYPIRALVSFKPEVVGPDGKLLPEKADTTHDLYVIEVHTYYPSEDSANREVLPYRFFKKMNVSEFMIFVVDEYRKHMQIQAKYLASIAAAGGTVCKSCKLDVAIRKCCCPPETAKVVKGVTNDTSVEKLLDDLIHEEEAFRQQGNSFANLSTHVYDDLDEEEKEEEPSRYVLKSSPDGTYYVPEYNPSAWDRAKFYIQDKYSDIRLAYDIYQTKKTTEDYLSRLKGLFNSSSLIVFAGVLAATYVATREQFEVKGEDLHTSDEDLRKEETSKWVRVAQTFVPTVPFDRYTWTKEQLVKVIHTASVVVQGPYYKTRGIVVANGLLLIPTHVLSTVRCDDVTPELDLRGRIIVHFMGREIIYEVKDMMIQLVSREAALCKVSEVTGSDITRFMYSEDELKATQFDEIEIHAEKQLVPASGANIVSFLGVRTIACKAQTQDGDCGAAYIVKGPYGWRFIAIHWLGSDRGNARGVVLNGSQIHDAAKVFGVRVQGVTRIDRLLFKDGVVPEMEHFPLRSEAYVAYSEGKFIMPLGTMKGHNSFSTVKTKLVKTLFYEDVIQHEKEMCGETPYWLIGRYGGAMFGDPLTWVSPVTNAMSHSKQLVLDDDVALVALGCFLSGLNKKIGSKKYRELTFEESIKGVPHLCIQRTDLSTSMGPPLYGSKHRFIEFQGDDVIVDPEVISMDAELVSELRQGIVAVLSSWTIKDEPVAVKPGTPFGHKIPRIFTNPPANFNFALRQILGGCVACIRDNKQFFETAIGIDMTSHEANDVVEFLKQYDETLLNITEQDVKAMDKSWIAQHFDYVAKVFYAIAFAIGTDAKAAENCILSVGRFIHSYKADLFMCNQLPSGVLVTVEMNSFNLSLAYRYGYYMDIKKSNPQEWERRFPREKLASYRSSFYENPFTEDFEFTFRKEVGLVSYGDDSLRAGKFISTESLNTWGLTFQTAGTKTSSIGTVPITEATFLKRSFVFNSQLERYIAPLSTKSLMRLLLIKKDSTLSLKDHSCVAITSFLREAVYHGREFYDLWYSRFDVIVRKYELRGPYLVMASYDFWFDKVRNKDYRSWIVWGLPDLEVVDIEKMSSQLLVDSASVAENFRLQGETEDSVTNIENPMGSLISSSPMVVAGTATTATVGRSVNQSANAILQRPLLVYTYPVTTSDVFLSQVYFDPHSLFFKSPVVYDVMDNYRMWRGTLRVSFTTSVAALMGGRYTISAVPLGGQDNTAVGSKIGPLLYPYNSSQGDFFCEIDMASSANGYLDLPFYYFADYAPCDLVGTPLAVHHWNIVVTCVCPLVGGVTGTATSGQIQFFASFLPDVELAAPVFHVNVIPTERYSVQGQKGVVVNPPTVRQGFEQIGTAFYNAVSAPSLKTFTGVLSGAGAGLQTIASALGFSRKSQEDIVQRIQLTSISETATCDGADNCRVVALSTKNAITIDPAVAGVKQEVDPCSFADLCGREVIVSWADWLSTDAQGYIMIRQCVTPFAGYVNNSLVHPTTMGYVGMPFAYWRGTMRFRVVVGCSSAHRGSLQIFWNPDNVTVSGDITNSLMNHIVDISANNEVIFDVGYNQLVPYLKTGFNSVGSYDPAKSNGVFCIRVLNPLRAQATSSLKVVVYASMLDDVQFQGIASTVNPSVTTGLHRLVVQGAVGDEVTKVHTLELAPAMGPYSGEISFGEVFTSVRALMQKPSRLFGGGNAAGTICSILIDQLGPAISNTAPMSNYPKNAFTFARYYALMYAGIATSEKVRVVTSTDCMVRGYQYTLMSSSYNELHTHNSISANSTGDEIRFPYYNPRKFVDPSYFSTAGNNNYGRRVSQVKVDVRTMPADGPYAQYWFSYGPDIRVTYFRQTLAIGSMTADPTTNVSAPYQTPSPYTYPAPALSLDQTLSRAEFARLMEEQELLDAAAEGPEEEEGPFEEDRSDLIVFGRRKV